MEKSVRLWLLAMVLLVQPAIAQAQFTYTTNADNTITITGYTGSNGVVTIPANINGNAVSSIGDWAFYAANVTNVLIPDSVMNIGDGAFFDCQSLTNVTIGNSVTNIGDWTFGFCSRLARVYCRGNAPSLGGGNVFYGNLALIYYLSGATGWGPTFDGHPAILWNPPVPFTYTTNSDYATLTIAGYTGSNGVATIPDNIGFLPVTSIGGAAFYLAGVTNVLIPDSISDIEGDAFEWCTHLVSVRVPSSVTNVGEWAFGWCTSLTNIVISSSLTRIGQYTFYSCVHLASVTIPSGVTSIGDSAFEDCALSSIEIPNSVTSLGLHAFRGCNLTNAVIPGSVTSIGDGAFEDCIRLSNISIPKGITTLNYGIFSSCMSLTNVTIPSSVTNIDDWAFGYCYRLSNIMIPSSVIRIGEYAFYSCGSIVRITIPSSVTTIGDDAFLNCTNLNGIFFKGNIPVFVGASIFTSHPGPTVYYLPGTTGWGSTFAGAPTELWLPQAQPTGTGFGETTNPFGFNINWASGQTVAVDACTNLANPSWQPLQTNTLTTGSAYFSDPQWMNYPARFYRLRSL